MPGNHGAGHTDQPGLRTLLLSTNLRRAGIARYMEVNKATVSHWALGQRPITERHHAKLRTLLETDTHAESLGVRTVSDLVPALVVAAVKQSPLTQRNLARHVGVSDPQMSRWITRQQVIPAHHLASIKDLLRLRSGAGVQSIHTVTDTLNDRERAIHETRDFSHGLVRA